PLFLDPLGWSSSWKFLCPPTPFLASSSRPSAGFHIVTNTKLTSGFASMNPLQPPFASSAVQLGHHGAQRCTTVTLADFVACASCCSTEGAAPSCARRPHSTASAAAQGMAILRIMAPGWHISGRMRSLGDPDEGKAGADPERAREDPDGGGREDDLHGGEGLPPVVAGDDDRYPARRHRRLDDEDPPQLEGAREPARHAEHDD